MTVQERASRRSGDVDVLRPLGDAPAYAAAFLLLSHDAELVCHGPAHCRVTSARPTRHFVTFLLAARFARQG